MRYYERKEFLYDSEIFRRSDVKIALQIQAEYVRTFSPIPYPTFFEVNRQDNNFDDLWHMPLPERTTFSRTLDIPAIVNFEKPDWRLTKLGIKPIQHYKFWLANLHLHPLDETTKDIPKIITTDYFPLRGDQIYYNGYRLMIINTVLDPKAYWAQTNVWLGCVVEASIVPDGDARPIPDLSVAAPAETPASPVPNDWPGLPPNEPIKTPTTWP
jgi:hypothetical protein